MSEKHLAIPFCGDCFHCKDEVCPTNKDKKSLCVKTGKYFNHNAALFPDWCPLPDEGKTEREEILEDIYRQWSAICRKCEHGASTEEKAQMIGFLQTVLDAKLGEKEARKQAFLEAAEIADKLCLDALDWQWSIERKPDLVGNRLREKADEEA